MDKVKNIGLEVIILSSVFMVVLLVSILLIVMYIKKRTDERDIHHTNRHNDLVGEVNSLKKLIIDSFAKKINQLKK